MMNRFELLRYERGLTQVDVAQGSGIAIDTIRRLERVEEAKPTAPVAKALADFYEIPVVELMTVKDAA